MAKWDIEAFRARGPSEGRTADLVRRIYDRHRDPSEAAHGQDGQERVVERMIFRADDERGSAFNSGDLSSDEYSALFQGLMDVIVAEG